MGASALPLVVITLFWAVVAFVVPTIVFVTNKPNKGVIAVVSCITGVSCWLFWILCYLHQMNPLVGPTLHNTTILAIMDIWDGSLNEWKDNSLTTTALPDM